MGEVKWTKEQQSAIDTRQCNLLVAAAAGSGKTAVLVERIIKIVMDIKNPVDIDRLLVVTFTNATAAEMRGRIGEAISRELDKNPESKLLQRQLTLLNSSNITTMHSFCLNVIRNNFHYIDLDPNFKIADQTEVVLLKQELLQELLEENYEKSDENFIALVESFGGSRDDSPLIDIISSLYNFSMSGPWPEKWLNEKAEEFNIPEGFDLGSTSWGKILKHSIEIDLLGARNKLKQAMIICECSSGLEPYLATIGQDLSLVEGVLKALKEDFDSLYRSFTAVDFTTIKRAGKDADKATQEKVKDIRKEVKSKINAIRSEVFSMTPEKSLDALKGMYPIMKALSEMVIEFDKKYQLKKKERGILDFNDLEHLCLKVLTLVDEEGNVKPSNIAVGFREKFEEVLVDEYQDSSNIQETIINMVSRKDTSNPNLFMVGDVKQSIYRFRQAKPELFLQKYNTYSQEDGKANRKILLYKNFRSREKVINAVNYIFKQIMSLTVGELNYTDKEALYLGAEFKTLVEENSIAGGEVEVHILDRSGVAMDGDSLEEDQEKESEDIESDASSDSNASGGANDNSASGSSKDTYNNISILEDEELDSVQLEARLVAGRIKELMNPTKDKTFKVYDKELNDYRKVKYKDIVILLRATSNWAPVFMEELGIEGIPVYADTGTGYFQTVEIRTVMSILQIIDNPLQDIPMLSTLRSPIFSFTPEELVDLRMIDRQQYFYENLRTLVMGEEEIAITVNGQKLVYEETLKEKAMFFLNCLERWRERSIHMSIDEFLWYLYMDTSYYGYVGAMPGGVLRQANLRILFQRARQYEKTSFSGLFNFINFINRLRNSSGDMGSAKILGENEDVVRLMSIHKSKGLEFPVVILAGCGKQFNLMDLNRSILIHEEMGYGPDYVDYKRRISYPTIKKQAIKKKLKLESLSEEMRILYVAFTRAKEKLIITGAVANFQKASAKWCSAAAAQSDSFVGYTSEQYEGIPEYEVIKGRTYLDWIGMALAKHKMGDIIRETAGSDVNITKCDELSTWNLKIWNKSDIIEDKNLETVDEFSKEKELFTEGISKGEYAEEIKRRLDWQYPYMLASKIATNISVSELKRRALDDGNEQNVIDLYKAQAVRKPLFLQEEKGLSASEKGTALHSVMQHLDLDKVSDLEEIEAQFIYFTAKEFLTRDEINAVNSEKILSFFSSGIGKRLLKTFKNTGKVYREIPFYIDIPGTVISKDLSEDIYKDEKVRIQGIIDCYFEEEDGNIVLLDYKTDYVGNESDIDDIKKRYEIQIKYYSETLMEMTEKNINEKYLYLFSVDRFIEMK